MDDDKTPLLREAVMDVYGTEDFEILAKTGMMWCGSGSDSQVYLVRLPDGRVELVIEDPGSTTDNSTDAILHMLNERRQAYRVASDDTLAFTAMAIRAMKGNKRNKDG